MSKFLILIGVCLLLFPACEVTEKEDAETEPEIGWTVVDSSVFHGSDELAVLPLEALPFSVSIPDSWSWTENQPEYLLMLNEGLTGSISFDKNLAEEDINDLVGPGWEVYFADDREILTYCLNVDWGESCFIHLQKMDEVYPASISDKGFSSEQIEQVEKILESLRLD